MKTYKSNWELGTFNKEQETLDVCWTIENEIVLNSYAEAQAYIKKNYYDFRTICVGNIYIGGTGKTPLVNNLASYFKKRI